jgi:hypothetical protein
MVSGTAPVSVPDLAIVSSPMSGYGKVAEVLY